MNSLDMTKLFAFVALTFTMVYSMALDGDSGSNDMTPKEQPPNEWGCYYNLPNHIAEIEASFNDAFRAYSSDPNKKTQCKKNDALFERWFISSKDDSHYLLSYYCKTKSTRGYEHLKVKFLDDYKFGEVLDFQDSLKKFGIVNPGDYNTEVGGNEAGKIQSDLLEKVKDQLKEQKNAYNPELELCPNPGNQVTFKAQTKKENGLYYTKFPISCNISDTSGTGANFMTNIEVVEDKDYKVINGGNVTLVSVEDAVKNIDFIRKKEEEAELEALKQNSANLPIMTALLTTLIPMIPIVNQKFFQ